mgnify:CR=1 FL=1
MSTAFRNTVDRLLSGAFRVSCVLHASMIVLLLVAPMIGWYGAVVPASAFAGPTHTLFMGLVTYIVARGVVIEHGRLIRRFGYAGVVGCSVYWVLRVVGYCSGAWLWRGSAVAVSALILATYLFGVFLSRVYRVPRRMAALVGAACCVLQAILWLLWCLCYVQLVECRWPQYALVSEVIGLMAVLLVFTRRRATLARS